MTWCFCACTQCRSIFYFCRVAISGPAFLPAALDVLGSQPKSYIGLIRGDLLCSFFRRGRDYDKPDPRMSLPDTIQWISSRRKRWKKLLDRLKAAVTSHCSLTSYAGSWHRESLEECDCRAFSCPVGDCVVSRIVVDDTSWFLFWCGYKTSSFNR